MVPLFCSIPHSGELIPPQAPWLKGLPEPVLMCDVDRYVDQLYSPTLKSSSIPIVMADCHRYAIDMNRLPDDYDEQSVRGGPKASSQFAGGLHWGQTTQGDVLLPEPMTFEQHEELVEKYWQPFHQAIREQYQSIQVRSREAKVYHLDLHSMPSKGTEKHRDPGETRAEIVVSDRNGTSCESAFFELVCESYLKAGFEVRTNWPYIGGRITEMYGQPAEGQHCIQVELSRAIYMDEVTKQRSAMFSEVQTRLAAAIKQIHAQVDSLV